MSRRIGLRTIPSLEAVELPVEGDYSNWKIYDTFLDDKVPTCNWCNAAFINRVDTVALLYDNYGSFVRKYDIINKILGAAESADQTNIDYNMFYKVSAYRTYAVNMDAIPPTEVYVYKNGVKIKTFTLAELDFSAMSQVSISPSGKYIFVAGTIIALGGRGWVVLVGS